MAEVESGGVRLHVEVHGSGPVVLLSHGFGATSAMFERNLEALSAANTVVTWDMPGHGSSDSPSDPARYSPAAFVAHMAAVLDSVGADSAILGGHSLGGYLSLEFRYNFPERVRGLILIDTGPGYRNDEAREGWNRMAERTATRLEERGLTGLGRSEELGAEAHRSADGLVMVARLVMTQRDGHVLESLGSIDVPTVVIVGSEDEPFLGGAKYMVTKIPGATHAVIQGGAHAPNVTHPAAFDDVVTEFLRRVG